jgi:hypothetical protein
MKHDLITVIFAGIIFSPSLHGQALPRSTLAPRVAEVVRRSLNGHSPDAEELNSVSTSTPDAADLQAAVPLLLKALANPDTPVRTYALTALAGLQVALDTDAAAPPSSVAMVATAYKSETTTLLTPAIANIASHLTEESIPNRILTATILGGFTPNPPAAVYPPLYAFLKRDDAIGQIGFAVVSDLLQFGPISEDTNAAVARFVRRSDQTPDSRANLVDLIATRSNQSQSLNKTLLTYLSSDEPGLRARVILSLPQLDLAPDVFADTRTRISQLADNTGENLQVVNAAKAIATCWTAVKMTNACPQY